MRVTNESANALHCGPMQIDPARPVPIYLQLKTLLVDAILERRFPDDRLPTEHELCEMHGISRTPVNRALSELAAEGMILRHRRRGSFVNPHWLGRRHGDTEIRVVVPAYGPWEQLIRDAADGVRLNIVRAPRDALHRVLSHAVAEGQAPDFAVFDHVWAPEFAAAGFLHPLEDLDPDWVRREHDVDFLASLAAADRYSGQTFGVSAFAEVAGLWYSKRKLRALGLDAPTTWAELSAAARALKEAHPATRAAGDAGRHGRRRDHLLLPHRVARVQRRQRDRRRAASASARRRAPRRCASCAGSSPTDACPRRPSVTSGTARSTSSPTARRRSRSAARTRPRRSPSAPAPGRRASGTTSASLRSRPARTGQQASVAGAMIFAVFRQAAQPKEAMRLIERAVAPETLAAAARRHGRVPSRRSAIAMAGADVPILEQTAAILEEAVTRPWIPLYSRVSWQLQSMLESVLSGRTGPVPAAQHTAAMIAAITGRPATHRVGRSRRRGAVMGQLVRLEAPRQVAVVDYDDAPLEADGVRIATLLSGISAGTELTQYTRQQPVHPQAVGPRAPAVPRR